MREKSRRHGKVKRRSMTVIGIIIGMRLAVARLDFAEKFDHSRLWNVPEVSSES